MDNQTREKSQYYCKCSNNFAANCIHIKKMFMGKRMEELCNELYIFFFKFKILMKIGGIIRNTTILFFFFYCISLSFPNILKNLYQQKFVNALLNYFCLRHISERCIYIYIITFHFYLIVQSVKKKNTPINFNANFH